MNKMVVLMAILLSGCMGRVYLYPVLGPMATQLPPPVLTMNVVGFQLTVAMPNGDVCKGTGKRVPHTENPVDPLTMQWDQVYGSGYYVAHVLGSSGYSIATLTCTQGSAMRVETTIVGGLGNPASQVGVAGDDKGNVLKLAL